MNEVSEMVNPVAADTPAIEPVEPATNEIADELNACLQKQRKANSDIKTKMGGAINCAALFI